MNISREGQIDLTVTRYVEEVTATGFPRLRNGDIVFNNTNSVALVGKTSLVDLDIDWTYSNHMTAVRLPRPLSPAFFALQLHYFWMMGFFRHILTQYVNQASVSKPALAERVRVAIPPAPEQLRIVEEVNSLTTRLNDSVSSLQRAERNSFTLQTAIIRAAVTSDPLPSGTVPDAPERQELDLTRAPESRSLSPQIDHLNLQSSRFSPSIPPPTRQDSAPPWPLPLGWSWTTVREVADVRGGKQRSPETRTGQHTRPYLRVANVFEDRIDTTDLKEMDFPPRDFATYRLIQGDILLNEGQSINLVGRPAMFRGHSERLCFQNTLIRFRAKDIVEPEFALLVFRYYFRSGIFGQIARWSTNIAHLGLNRFASMPFPLPPRVQQEEIASRTKRQLSVVATQQGALSLLVHKANALRRSILARAFAGALLPQQETDGNAHDLLARVRAHLEASGASRVDRRRLESSPRTRPALRTKDSRSIYDVLDAAGGRLVTSALLDRCRFGDHNIEQFYEELKHGINAGRIREVRGTPAGDENARQADQIELVPSCS